EGRGLLSSDDLCEVLAEVCGELDWHALLQCVAPSLGADVDYGEFLAAPSVRWFHLGIAHMVTVARASAQAELKLSGLAALFDSLGAIAPSVLRKFGLRRLGSRQDVSPSLSFRWKYFVTRLLYGEDGLFHKQTNSAKYHGGHSCGFPISLKRHEIADPVAMNPWDSASPENGLEHDDTTIHTVAEHGVNLELFTAIPRIVNKQPPAEEHNDPIIPNIADGEDSVPFTTIPHIKNTQSHIDDLRRPGYVIQHRDSLAVNWFDLEHFEEDRYADLISPKAAEHGENSEPSIMPSPSTETQTPAEAPDDSISSKLAERDGEKVSRLLDGCCHAWRVGGPDLLAGLKPMIMEIVRKAVEEALAELLPTPRRTVTVNEDPERARRRGKGKAQGDAVPEPYPSSISGKGRGKEAPKGDKGQNQPNKGKGAGGENGKGAKGKSKPVAPVNDAEDGWVQVVRRKIDKSQTFVLDPADWDAPVIPFCELGERFNKLESGGTLKAIILCKDDQLKTAKVMAAGSKLPHSLTLITTDKKGDERIPGRLDGLRHFITGFIHQVTSEGNTAPRSTGQKAAITIEKTDTTVLFVRVSKLYAKWGWQDFRQSPTKAMMKWASKYEIALVDTWGWQQQRTAQGSDQVFGILRMNGDQVKDALRHSGAEGVFLEPHRQFMATRIEWHTPEQDESHEHFFERVYKLQKELGLATSGQNLGVRFPLQSSDRIQRQWVLQGVPLHWGFPEVTKALQSAFTEIVITASKRGRGDKSIFYKATATLEASRDIVPISVIYDGNEMVLWAKWAPPRHQKVSMRNLRHNIVPVVDAPKILSIPAAKPDEPLTETDDKNKEVPQGKRPKTEEKKRSIPACLQLCAQPRDGNCLFHSLCQGLAWVTKHQKKPLVMTAREMRARLVERLRRHSELYETDHDGLGPSGAPATWKEYLSQIEVEGTYGGQLEVRAFARIFDCRVIVIPEFTAFPCESFHNKAKSRVIATWLTGSPCAHMDLLLPKGASEETATAKTLSLPQEILSIQAPPAVSYRVGGTGSRTEKRWTTRVGDPSYAGIPKETGLGHGATQIRIARDIKDLAQAHALFKKLRLSAEERQVQNFQVYCISEADVNTFSGPGYLQAWRSRGWTAALSEGLEGISKVALASSHHFRIIRLPTEEASGRHVAGIFEFRNQQQKVIEVLIVAFYGCPQSEARAQAQAMDVLMAAKSTGLPFIVAGDWNTTQETGALARAIQNQAVLACDEVDLSSNLPATGPIYSGSRRRRIDFAIAENHCSPVGLAHHANAALSDHLLVQYDFDFSAALPWVQPARNPIRKDITEREAEAFFSHVDASAFNEFLGRDDVDMAWQWLSDTAESCLCQHIEHPMRSEPWEPSIIPRKRFQGCVSGSRGYKALLKLQARLQVLANRPWDTALHQRLQSSLYHVRQLCPELPHLDLFAPEAAHVVQKLLQQYRQVEQQVMREQWRRCTQNDPSRIRSFVKRKVDAQVAWEQEVPSLQESRFYQSPAEAVDQQASNWMDKWGPDAPECSPMVHTILRQVPRPDWGDISFRFSGQALRAAMSKMKHKAAGADTWRPCDLLLLPERWYDMAAKLWERVMALRTVPHRWREATVTLLRKPGGKTRPITLLPAIWRAGTRCLLAQLRPWCNSWRSPRVAGIPGTSVAGGLGQLYSALQRGAKTVVTMDIEAFYDSIGLPTLCQALRHLKCPEALIQIIESFYKGARRIFQMNGACSRQWYDCNMGLAQGCPLSPVLASVITHCWITFVLASPECRHLDGLGYIDDRSLWLGADGCTQEMITALERSGIFDEASGFTLSLPKCKVTSRVQHADVEGLRSQFGFQDSEVIELLGVAIPFEGPWRLLKLHLRKVLLRLRLLAWTNVHRRLHQHLIASLVMPSFTWCAAFADMPPQDLATVKNEVLNSFENIFKVNAARALIFETVGWQLEPSFALDSACLRTWWKLAASPPDWTECLPLAAINDWLQVLPRLSEVLLRYHWWIGADGRSLLRHDDTGQVRQVRCGYDSFDVVLAWMVQVFRDRYVLKAPRVKRRLHRDDVTRATGLDLPPPSPGSHFYLNGRLSLLDSGGSVLNYATWTSGGTAWHYTAGRKVDDNDAQSTCLCGLKWPSRPHLLWKCPSTADLRVGLTPPSHRAAERMLLLDLPEWPAAPRSIDPGGLLEELCDELCRRHREPVIYLAVDGSEKDHVGAFAVTVEPQRVTVKGSRDDEDQTPFKQEILSLRLAVQAVSSMTARVDFAGVFVFIGDCKAALRAAEPACVADKLALPSLVRETQQAFRELDRTGVRYWVIWVPSHGKKPEWRAPEDLCGSLLRDLNDSVDCSARDAMNRRWRGSARARWFEAWRGNLEWQDRAVHAAAAASERLMLPVDVQGNTETEMHGQLSRESGSQDKEGPPACPNGTVTHHLASEALGRLLPSLRERQRHQLAKSLFGEETTQLSAVLHQLALFADPPELSEPWMRQALHRIGDLIRQRHGPPPLHSALIRFFKAAAHRQSDLLGPKEFVEGLQHLGTYECRDPDVPLLHAGRLYQLFEGLRITKDSRPCGDQSREGDTVNKI
ncbi:unnamed protein product, partial [Symbiodinium microadriaticum]